MNTNIIRLCHFYDKEAYCKLQEYFGSHDYKRNYDDRIENPIYNLKIIYHEFDEFSLEEDWKEMKFINDFLKPGLNNLSENYIEYFNKEINSKGLFTKDLLDGFAKHYRNKLDEIRRKIVKSNFLEREIIMLVLLEIRLISDYTNEFFSNPYPNIKLKIQVNWSRTRLIYFFHLLRQNKQISWIEDADLGRVIDSVFEYQNSEKDGEYIACKDSRKHLNAFKNTLGRPENKANKELKEVFMNEDFYNV